MKNSSCYSAKTWIRIPDLPHRMTITMGKYSHTSTHEATEAVSIAGIELVIPKMKLNIRIKYTDTLNKYCFTTYKNMNHCNGDVSKRGYSSSCGLHYEEVLRKVYGASVGPWVG